MTQREQDAKLEIVEGHVHAVVEQEQADRIDLRFLDEQGRIMERDFRGRISSVEARQQMIEQQMQDIDLHGSRRGTQR